MESFLATLNTRINPIPMGLPSLILFPYRPSADHAPRTRYARACRHRRQRLLAFPPPPTAAATPPLAMRTRYRHRAGCRHGLSRAASGMDCHIPDMARGSPAPHPAQCRERVLPGGGCVAAARPLGGVTADAAAGRRMRASVTCFSGVRMNGR